MKKMNMIICFLVSAALCLVILSACGCQSRKLSRITGRALKLELPEDFEKPISFAARPLMAAPHQNTRLKRATLFLMHP